VGCKEAFTFVVPGVAYWARSTEVADLQRVCFGLLRAFDMPGAMLAALRQKRVCRLRLSSDRMKLCGSGRVIECRCIRCFSGSSANQEAKERERCRRLM
jgi:hypothetical protein